MKAKGGEICSELFLLKHERSVSMECPQRALERGKNHRNFCPSPTAPPEQVLAARTTQSAAARRTNSLEVTTHPKLRPHGMRKGACTCGASPGFAPDWGPPSELHVLFQVLVRWEGLAVVGKSFSWSRARVPAQSKASHEQIRASDWEAADGSPLPL